MKIIKQVVSILLFSSAVILTGCSSDSATAVAPPVTLETALPPIGDVSGSWSVTETSVSSNASCGGYKAYYLDLTQTGNSVVVGSPVGTFNGIISANKITWTGSYPEQGGTTTASTVITVGADCSSFTSTATWSYTEAGWGTCTGTSTASGYRINGTGAC